MIKKKLFLTAALICSITCTQTTIASQSLDRIVATVNDAVITQSELNTTISGLKKQMLSSNMAVPPADVLHKQVLDQLINKKLQLQTAEQAGVNVTDETVDKAINTIAQENKVTVNDVYEKLASQGLSREDYRAEIHDELVIQQIQQQEVGSKIVISPEEVKAFTRSKSWQASNTKEYHLDDILITLPDAPTSEQIATAKKTAQDLLAKIRKGADFSSIAAAESDNNKNALQGGDLGWRKLPEVPSAFAEQLIHLQTNEVMGPIQTPNGFHLVRLAGVRNIDNHTTVADQQKLVQQQLYQRKFEEGLQAWLTKIRSAAAIDMHPVV